VTNMGNDTAFGVWLNWSLPGGWSNTSGDLNKYVPVLPPSGSGDNSMENSINASVSSSATTGTQTIYALSSAGNKTGNDSVSVTVNAAQAPPVSTGGGGSVPTVQKAPPTYSPSKTVREQVLPTPKTLELVKGENLSFTIEVSNPLPNATMENISLKITGYKQEYIWITPAIYPEIESGSSKEFTVTVYAPPSEHTIYPLTIDVSGHILYTDYPTTFNERTNETVKRENVTVAMLETRNINLITYGESPPSYSPTSVELETLLPKIDPIELVRGSKNTLSVTIENPFEGSELNDLKLRIEGYPEEYLSITPFLMDGIGYKGATVFDIVFEAPSYFEKETRDLKMFLSGVLNYPEYPAIVSEIDGRALLTKDYSLEMAEEKDVTIFIHEISRGATMEALENAAGAIEEMRMAELGVTRAKRRLENAKNLFFTGDYEGASRLVGQIIETKDSAFEAKDLLDAVSEGIRTAEEERWLKVVEAKNLYNLALIAYEREDYPTAMERLKEAQNTLSLETEGKINKAKLVLDNLLAFIVGGIILLFSSVQVFKRAKIARASSKLRDLLAEEGGIIRLMREKQARYYKDKTMAHETYLKAMGEHRDRLSSISAARVGLIAEMSLAIGAGDGLESLGKEDASLLKLLEEAQADYFKNRTMSKSEYQSITRLLKTERAVVQGRMALLEAELEKGRMME
ncbi:MAG: hypothetical protein V3V92_03930, partial [Candidatus Hydrothermarchaeales archaeon]